ncbi:hypothetical protein GGTG_00576 [Gaeumannomyces tritici R3-111a-1]|uniref:Uncharacterized protein n=1 Tax=Gaeumannomyces tritici (strain R3-111a-1) TaxID=644352 RepID=J3NH38_GAET3|nr:hypothetical protein GGTG_00576 [Gaeumannomyces tritici R3-111a-1]EJT80581.1 hypothetical protein GGTG_00576 [Gaeumannomyces tritici R3-111a-1]
MGKAGQTIKLTRRAPQRHARVQVKVALVVCVWHAREQQFQRTCGQWPPTWDADRPVGPGLTSKSRKSLDSGSEVFGLAGDLMTGHWERKEHHTDDQRTEGSNLPPWRQAQLPAPALLHREGYTRKRIGESPKAERSGEFSDRLESPNRLGPGLHSAASSASNRRPSRRRRWKYETRVSSRRFVSHPLTVGTMGRGHRYFVASSLSPPSFA